jgi:hypothetical protein
MLRDTLPHFLLVFCNALPDTQTLCICKHRNTRVTMYTVSIIIVLEEFFEYLVQHNIRIALG